MKKVDLLQGQSLDVVNDNIQQLKALFPEAFTENGVDFDVLRQLLGDAKVLDEGEEKYGLNWHGKKKSRQIALTPSLGTLLPCEEESVDWDKTGNLFIEGDNLEVLKLLQKSYVNKVKMIYIDPPYNTGNEFVYPDNYQDNLDTYLRYTGQKGEDGLKFSTNSESSGRKHTNWLNMMYPRLKLAKNLLRHDGVIFISIDDNELINLTKVANEVFGEDNLINHFVWRKNSSGKTVSKQFPINIDHLLMYSKSSDFKLNVVYKPLSEATIGMYNKKDNDDRGKYRFYPLQKTKSPGPETTYDYTDNNGKIWSCPEKGWRMVQRKLKALENDNRLAIDGKSLQEKAYWNERENEGKVADTLWDDLAENNVGTAEFKKLFGVDLFDNPKPTDLIERCLKIGVDKENVILDFFAGSSTTAHAVMQLNAEDGGNRKFIMVQLPELCDEKSEAFKAGYKTIADIGKERIRRAANKIKQENPDYEGDLGFKVFKLSSSNIKIWNPDAADIETSLQNHTQSLVEGRREQDILYELLLKRGVDLTTPIATKIAAGKTIYSIGYGVLFACLDI